MNVEGPLHSMPMGGAFAAVSASGPDPTKLATAGRDRESVAQGFEELLLAMFVKELRQTSGVNLFGESTGSHLLEAMFDQQLAASLAEGGGIGIGDQLARHLPGADDAWDKRSRTNCPASPTELSPQRAASRAANRDNLSRTVCPVSSTELASQLAASRVAHHIGGSTR